MADESMMATASVAGVNWEDAKQGIERLLPILERVARLTPNKFDDAAVLFLKALLVK